jgi:hypothetical protein
MNLLDSAKRPLRGVVGVILAVPAVIDAILVLPTMSRQLEDVRTSTATLPQMLVDIQRLKEDTIHLAAMDHEIARMANCVAEVEKNTAAVEQLAEIAVPLQGAAMRVGRFADRLPQRRFVREASENGRPAG